MRGTTILTCHVNFPTLLLLLLYVSKTLKIGFPSTTKQSQWCTNEIEAPPPFVNQPTPSIPSSE